MPSDLRKRDPRALTWPKAAGYTADPMTADDRRDHAWSGSRSDYWSGVGTGWAISGTLLGGMLALGGLGYLVDRLLGTAHVFTAIGFLVGGAGGVYSVYLRYGRGEDGDSGA